MNPETERVHASFPFTVTFCFSDHIYSHLPSSRYIILCGLRLLLLQLEQFAHSRSTVVVRIYSDCAGYIGDTQWFEVECGIQFTSKAGFLIFSRVRSSSVNMNKKSFLMSEINSTIIVKTVEYVAYCKYFLFLDPKYF